MNLRLLRLFAPWYRAFADEGGGTGGGGSQDGAGSGAQGTPPAGDAGKKGDGAETITLSRKDYDGLMGRLGQMEDADRRRKDAETKAKEDEAKKRGEHEQLLEQRNAEIKRLSPYEQRFTERVKADHERRMKGLDGASEAVVKLYRKGTADKPLTLEDMEYNLAKLDEHEGLGVLGKKEVVLPRVADGQAAGKSQEPPPQGRKIGNW